VTIQTRRLEQSRSCRYQASLTAGTVFHRKRKPLRLWFVAISFLGRHKTGIPALQLQKDLGLASYKTERLRHVDARHLAREHGMDLDDLHARTSTPSRQSWFHTWITRFSRS